jgi:ferredoxin
MSDQTEKFKENAPGRYYVTKVCIDCALCSAIAPDNFRENDDMELAVGNSYVYKQPENEAQENLCLEAMDVCPANAIRNNGLND